MMTSRIFSGIANAFVFSRMADCLDPVLISFSYAACMSENVAVCVQSVPDADVESLELDLRTLESVHQCANQFKAKKLPLNILVRTPWRATHSEPLSFPLPSVLCSRCQCFFCVSMQVNNAGAAMGSPWYTPEGVGGSAQVFILCGSGSLSQVWRHVAASKQPLSEAACLLASALPQA